MKVILFGATGMVGQGVLRECLAADDVETILVIGRTSIGIQPANVREVLLPDLTGYDACFFCLGVSAAGMSEAEYTRITYDVTLAAAGAIVKQSPQLTFIYVSGQGTDSTENKGSMWARVKGRTENALLALPFKAAVMFRPGLIRPMHGIRSKTKMYRVAYIALWPLFPLFSLFGALTTTERVGKAMLHVARSGSPKQIVTNRDIDQLAA